MIDQGMAEYLAFHLLFSFLLLVEGMTRVGISANMGHFGEFSGEEDQFPPVVLLITALMQVVFSLVGFTYSLYGMMVGMPTELATKVVIGVEMLMGWPVLLIWVVVLNAYNAAKDVKGVEGFGEENMDSLIVISLFGGLALCAALQGGQVFFAFQSLAVIQGTIEERQRPSALTGRLFYYLILFTLAATTTVAAGGYFLSHSLSGHLGCPPFFYTYPEIFVGTGSFMVVVALIGWGRVVGRLMGVGGSDGVGGKYLFVGLLMFSYILFLGLHVATQLSLFSPPPGTLTPTGPLTVLGFAVHFMPGYLDFQVVKCKE